MMHSDKYAVVNVGDAETVLVRIKKPTPVMEADKAKLKDWAEKNGFGFGHIRHIIHAE
jgi:hypothetical protein